MIEEKLNRREYANVWTRFASIIIDSLLVIPFYIPVWILSAQLESGKQITSLGVIVMLVSIFSMVAFSFWNNIIRMGQTGQSLGKKFLNIAVLNFEGKPIGIGKAFLREVVGRFVSGLICYIGYLNAFWDRDKQMWHDKIASCYVYYVEDNFS